MHCLDRLAWTVDSCAESQDRCQLQGGRQSGVEHRLVDSLSTGRGWLLRKAAVVPCALHTPRGCSRYN